MELIFIILLLITNAITLAFLVPIRKKLSTIMDEHSNHMDYVSTEHEKRIKVKNAQIAILENNIRVIKGGTDKFTK